MEFLFNNFLCWTMYLKQDPVLNLDHVYLWIS